MLRRHAGKVDAAVEDYLERKVYQLTSPPSKDNVESRRRAKKILQENGLEYKDLKALLYQTAKSRGMKTQQAENGKPTSYGERVKRLKD